MMFEKREGEGEQRRRRMNKLEDRNLPKGAARTAIIGKKRMVTLAARKCIFAVEGGKVLV
jgi:hypothetical protein